MRGKNAMTLIQGIFRHRRGDMEYPPSLPSATTQANRRRLLVFLGVFAPACVVSLSYTFLRAPEYRALSILKIIPGSDAPRPIETVTGQPAEQVAESAKPFLTEVQVLTSRPVLEETITRLARNGYDVSSLGPDPVAGMQSTIQVSPVSGTNVVEMAAVGAQAELLAPLLNTTVEAYREHLAAAYRDSTSQVLADADEETQKLEYSVAEKRHEVEMFRIQHDIVSLEREENQVLSRVRGVATSLNTANERVATAEGRLRSVSESMASGNTVTRSRDDPTLANLEQRASMIREELGDLERSFTPDYMALDPKIKAKRVRLEELERQIEVQRKLGSQAALAEAREELASARETASRIRQQAASDHHAVQQFTARFNEYKALQDELTELETLYRSAAQRKVRLETSERTRMPSVQVIEAATTPQQAWRPLYGRDAALSVAGSFLLALLAMWFVELFNRPEPQPSLLITQPATLIGTAPQAPALAAVANRMLAFPEQPLLSSQPSSPPELAAEEVAALLQAGTRDSRLAMLLLLSGMSAEEVLTLGWDNVDLAQRMIRIRGESARDIPLNEPLFDILGGRPVLPGMKVLADSEGREFTMDDLNTAILCAAHDAGIENAGAVTPAALRHTFIAFLVRQGIRFADLMQLVGRLSAEAVAAYSGLSPAGPRVPLENIERVMPPLKGPGQA
jgi:polysaccharide biosynthesis transport protein